MGDVRIRVRQRKNGQNVYEYSFEGLPIDGKRNIISKSGFKTKKEAKAAGQEEKEKYEKLGQITKIKEMSYSDFLDEWLKKDCVHCKRTTIQGYIKRINLYIKPQIGYKKLTAINRDDIQELMTNMYNDGFSINTIVCVRGILSKSFDYAIIERIIPFSPVMRITIPTNNNPKNQTRENPHAYIPEDIMIKIFKRFPEGTTAYIPLMIAYHTGLRLGEVYALTWNDIDLKNKTLSVNRQVQWQAGTKTKEEINKTKSQKSDGFWYFSTPKYDSYRTIDIDDELTEILLNERNKQRSFKKIYGDNYYKYYCEQALTYNGHKLHLADSWRMSVSTILIRICGSRSRISRSPIHNRIMLYRCSRDRTIVSILVHLIWAMFKDKNNYEKIANYSGLFCCKNSVQKFVKIIILRYNVNNK